jgi:hypothetical protein
VIKTKANQLPTPSQNHKKPLLYFISCLVLGVVAIFPVSANLGPFRSLIENWLEKHLHARLSFGNLSISIGRKVTIVGNDVKLLSASGDLLIRSNRIEASGPFWAFLSKRPEIDIRVEQGEAVMRAASAGSSGKRMEKRADDRDVPPDGSQPIDYRPFFQVKLSLAVISSRLVILDPAKHAFMAIEDLSFRMNDFKIEKPSDFFARAKVRSSVSKFNLIGSMAIAGQIGVKVVSVRGKSRFQGFSIMGRASMAHSSIEFAPYFSKCSRVPLDSDFSLLLQSKQLKVENIQVKAADGELSVHENITGNIRGNIFFKGKSFADLHLVGELFRSRYQGEDSHITVGGTFVSPEFAVK